jgi:hypothetical protein
MLMQIAMQLDIFIIKIELLANFSMLELSIAGLHQ